MIRWLIYGAAAVAVVAAGAVGAYVLRIEEASEDVEGSSTEEFVETQIAEETIPRGRGPQPQELPGVLWPNYGFNPERLRTAGYDHRPPYRRIWTFGARSLVEFPPAIAYGRLYFSNNSGTVFAVNAKTGKRAWRKRIGRCAASTPAVSNHVVFFTFMNALPCTGGREDDRRDVEQLRGEVIAFASGFGRVRWRKKIGPSETSPLVVDGLVYVGDWHGNVWALDERTGETVWRFKTGGEVKGGVAVSGNRLYVGSYDHHVYALNAKTGKLLWKRQAQRRLGRRGTFYSTPAAAYGRVYIGSTDGKVYSLGATSGEIRWSQSTGGFVYSSPAVWRQRVFAGSYSRKLYAFDAATGKELWTFRANGRISGSPTVVNGVVYFATLAERTYAVDARTGKQLWTFPDGKYTPVVADDERVYVVGHARVYGMVERERG